MATVELHEQQWKKFSENDYAVIDCYGENCTACVMLEPIFDAVADELAGVSFGRINISFEPEIADTYGIDAMPTLLLFRKGQLVDRFVGSMSREKLLELMSRLLYQ